MAASSLPRRTSAWARLSRNGLAVVGLAIVVAIVGIALLAPVLPLADPDITAPANRLLPPFSHGAWLGTDQLGRDMLSRLVWGARVSIAVGVAATLVAAFVGSTIGLVAAYFGRLADNVLMRGVDMLMAFPYLLLALAIVAALGPGLLNALLAIAVVNIPFFARSVRGATLGLVQREFIEAARLSGYSNAFVFAKERLTHILKRRIVEQNRQNVADAVDGAEAAGATAPPEQDEADGDAGDSGSPEQALAVAILDRLYEQTHARGIPLVIQSIPIPIGEDEGELVETFPVDYFDLDREGLYFVGMAGPLTPWVGREPLYNRRSHGHWTAFAHRVSGETLARLVLREHLLDRSMTAAAVAGHALPSRSAAQQPQGDLR